ncbi:MAG: hypothetical protein GY864_05805, partial [Desulfobacterales bacterium]|nr:hypothetical protein [Desulfobacterales bacterium]
MKFNLISALLRRFNKAFTKMRRRRRRMLVLILILPFLGVFCDPCPKASPAFTEKVFRLGFRDMALGIHFMDDKTGWAVGSFGLAMKTEDGGENWQKVPISEEHYLKDVFFFGKKGWMVGELGVILSTNDGGKKWSEQKSNVGQSLLSVFFINENTGFTVGGDGTMLKTNNGGASWDLIDMSWPALIPDELLELGTVSINLYDVFFLNETIGWIVGDAGTVLRTGDGGKEWILAQMGD